MRPLVLGFLVLALALTGASKAQADALSSDQIKDVVRELLREEPELVFEALRTLQERQERQQAEAQAQQLSQLGERLRYNEADPVMGNPDGEIVIVEFFDYACGFCKRAHPVLQEAVESRGNVRWVLKEFPILGEGSVTAARYSLAAKALGGYAAFHDALMKHRGALNEGAVRSAADQAGLDFDALTEEAGKPIVSAILQENQTLAQMLGIRGTPYMLIGEEAFPGFLSADQLADILDGLDAG